MKTQTDKTQEPQKETVQRVQQESSTGGEAMISDNRPTIIAQRKLRSAMGSADDTKTPIQRKNNTGLPDNLKSGIENLSGYSMDDVKVHYNSSKPAQLQAHAYAQGTDIHLAPGQQKHLPHEAWHVVQQKQGRVKPTRQLKSKTSINDDAGLEKEADVMGYRALMPANVNKATKKEVFEAQRNVQKDKETIQGKWSYRKELTNEEEAEAPATAEEAVAAVLQLPDKESKVMIVLYMYAIDDFIPKLTEDERGKELLESIVKGSVIAWSPDVTHILKVNRLTGGPGPIWASRIVGIPRLIAPLIGGIFWPLQRLIGLGWSNSLSSHRNLIKDLIKKEYDIEFSGIWSEAELRSTYLAFRKVPPGHVKETVGKMTRDFSPGGYAKRGELDFISKNALDYGPGIINMGQILPTRASMGDIERGTRIFGSKFLKRGSSYYKKGKSHNTWTHTLLHEVGHTVDFERNIMGTHGSKKEFGGWEEYGSTKSLAEDMVRNVQPFQPTDVVTHSMLKAAIKGASEQKTWSKWSPISSLKYPLSKRPVTNNITKKVEEAEDFKDLADEQKPEAMSRILNHPVVKMVRSNFKIGAWQRKDSKMKEMAEPLGGRYYLRSYPGSWSSFLVSSRKDAVSHYQYRSPGEWFAELYAFYYMGSLDGHPLYDWFEREIHKDLNPGNVRSVPEAPILDAEN